ncbi:DUF6509 family protein [Bacillus sp. T33-2]|uniref:DUF6509 family protein n=1 Tax=Bacillus sp. T33-2 TaxID=2054168 RepID=UPI000C78DDB5|nr:DUF6509 family protein [Bacillus sp. T33-2]PLR98835.1 pullulanase [Bacillus sp. T33-2]
MEITGHTVELLEDPFGLLEGDRYEFFLNIEVEEEDELYSENGLLLKVIFSGNSILQYYFIEKTTEKVLDFALEEDEEEDVKAYCLNNLPSGENDGSEEEQE